MSDVETGRANPAVTPETIDEARRRIAPIVRATPLVHSEALGAMLGAQLWFKPENLQKTGSFKIRGAYNRVAALIPEESRRGVIAASAGNHGQALACAATRAGVHATIVMPRSAAIAKIDATRGYGQEVVLAGADYGEARAAAQELRTQRQAIFVDAYDDPFVIAGQGTAGLEIIAEFTPDVVLVPVGGGGLLAGIATAIKAHAPAVEIIGVEAAGSPQLSASFAANAAVALDFPVDTIADGLATGRIGALPFDLIRERVRRVVTVDDFEIGEAMLLLLERVKLLTESAGATALAGALKIRDELRGRKVVVVLSGGNIDINLLDRVIGYGLVKAGRLLRLEIDLHDRPGELQKLLALVSAAGANVHTVEHDRLRRGIPISGVRVMIEMETRGPEHARELRERLQQSGYRVGLDEFSSRAAG